MARCQRKKDEKVNVFVDSDPSKISWTQNLKDELTKNRRFVFDAGCLTQSIYRPFTKQWLYYNRRFNERVYQMPRIFPNGEGENRVIMVKQRSVAAGNSHRCLTACQKLKLMAVRKVSALSL